MGIADRKIREKEELTRQILDAAKALFIEKGLHKTSIRNIADRIEYSPGIIYHYFKDKNEIFHAIHTEGFIELRSRLQVLASVENPMERLKALGTIYIQFALENSDMYDLMFIIEAPMDYLNDTNTPCWDEGMSAFDALKSTIKECMDLGHFQGQELEPLTFMIWSTVHGMVSLKIRQRTNVIDPEEVEHIVDNAFKAFKIMLDKV
ncbi:TetR/AcrR family transcriptional regulator [Marivirga sp. S37H4]|uniref:TetR/AcrR family transcriptional regulator n=1 Tax=Marivirga aurantiaca TaxID=2802615 RepID=A0A934X0S3_9BACT|nr:TetR/AcrR family transcriptional regulator [Marivirga aurantiaca]MBK6266569.1 TetR/AcrR family transcriptional regulator [Marivirga aurantiaca]